MQAFVQKQVLIDGSWCGSESGATFPVINPADGSTIAEVPSCGIPETRRAIEAADKAFHQWRGMTASERSRILMSWTELIRKNSSDLAALLTAEQGKPLQEARTEVEYGASFIEWFAEEAKRALGEIVPPVDRNKRILVLKEPVGVCAAITPWNFPVAMVTRKIAPALAAGCTVILKPAEQTPLSALALGKLAIEAGVPAGVINIITGAPEDIGKELTSNPLVRKLSFTGSTEVGRLLMAQCAGTLKRLSLELGGNAPFIVFADADVNAAVDGAIASKFRNAGQTCVCANRIFAERPICDEFSKRLRARVAALKVGKGSEPGVEIGPLIDESAIAKVEELLGDAVTRGAKVVIGGHRISGLFFEPTIVNDVTHEMRMCREEIFGPVAPVIAFDSEAEVIRMANDTEFGLSAYFYTENMSRAFRVAEKIEAGIVSINTGAFSTAVAPFGGVKQSGFGREGSTHGLDEFLQLKYCCFGLSDG